jgi:aminoglycoside N3'-acetyltransferase
MRIYIKIWSWLKKKFNIRSRSLLENQIRREIEKLFYKKRYSTIELINLMKTMGLRKGAIIMLHSSWDEFYNYSGNPQELIDAILNEIGADGTLIMPAYPLESAEQHLIDLKRSPTGAGLIAEIFRRYPNIKRSISPHSVCAIGPLSSYLLDEHQYSVTCWDEKSPYYKISKLDTLIFCIGLGKSFIPTSSHCVESLLRERVPYFGLFFTRIVNYKFRLEDKSIFEIKNITSDSDFIRIHTKFSDNLIIRKYFDKTKYTKRRLSNLTVSVYDAHYLVDRMIELGERGKTVYIRPNPKRFRFS